MLEIVLTIILIYFFLVFILSRLIIPHLGFKEERLPDKLPDGMPNQIRWLTSRAGSAVEFLNLAYDYLGSRYRSERFNTILKFGYLFRSLDQVWQMSGYTPCTQNNFLLTLFLINSGYFKNSDIRRKHVFVNFFLHQYLQVKVNKQWLDVDVGEKQRGLPIGKHLQYFG
jgi:hypothetical protein